MISRKAGDRFARQWEASWNSHDIDRIIGYYAEDVVLVSPIAGELLGDPEVRGIEPVRKYFTKGLEAYPDLRFEVLDVFCGVDSLVLHYVNQNGTRASEFMQLDPEGRVVRMVAHYGDTERGV